MHIDTHEYTYTVYIYQKLNFLSFSNFFSGLFIALF